MLHRPNTDDHLNMKTLGKEVIDMLSLWRSYESEEVEQKRVDWRASTAAQRGRLGQVATTPVASV